MPDEQPGVPNGGDELSLTSLDYPSGFYHEQAPAHLNQICALKGLPIKDLTRPFTYCELGCGTGLTTIVLAAANPAGRFVGLDLSESHIDSAKSLAAAGAVENVTFLAADIGEIDPAQFAGFDYVTFHGLYSWVPLEVRRSIVRFLEATLNPGGLIYISYNAMPGYGSVSPFRRFFLEMVPQLDGAISDRAANIVEQLQEMERKGAPFFVENPLAKKVLSHLHDYGVSYVAHEYLAAHWEALYFKDVAQDLAAAGLTFVGSAKPLENIQRFNLSSELTDYVNRIDDPLTREMVADFINNRFFRRDVFRREGADPRDLPADESGSRLIFAMNVAAVEFPRQAVLISDKVDLSGPIFDRIKTLLAVRNLTMEEILVDSELAAQPREEVERIFHLMTGDGFLGPSVNREQEPPDEPAERIQVMPALNRVLLEQLDWSRQGLVLASTVTGNGIVINRFEALLLLGLGRDDPVDWILEEMVRRDIHIRSRDSEEVVEGRDQERTAVETVIRQFLEFKLPKLAYLGIVGPASS